MESFAPFTSEHRLLLFLLGWNQFKVDFLCTIWTKFWQLWQCWQQGSSPKRWSWRDNNAISCAAPPSKVFVTLNWFQFKAMISLGLCTLSMWAFSSSSEYQLSRQWSHFEDQSHQRQGLVVFAQGFSDSRWRLFLRCSSMYWKKHCQRSVFWGCGLLSHHL